MATGPALIVGLGNPGPEYERTRHNVGFRVLETLASRLGAHLRGVKGIRALAAETRDGDRRVILAQPLTYMNLSGEAVRDLARYYKAEVEDVVVVHDELDLPFGEIRVKRGGGDAGNNGLRSITRALGSPGYARVRVGIGRPPGRMKGADYVLQAFSKKEEEEVGVAVERAADAALLVARDGVEAVQNALHAPPPQPKARTLRKRVVVEAPVEDVWDAWTSSEGARTFFAPDARIEPREGGAYELYFDPGAAAGQRGSERCEIVRFDPPRALSFTWNNPPSIPRLRWEFTRVDLALRTAGAARTRVSLTHRGWGDGDEWDRAHAYFDRAWDVVLERLARRFTDGPLDWSQR